MREIVVMAEAIKDILQARDFYERIERGVGIYYRDTSERTQVFAVLDLRRSPDWASKQLMRR